MCAVSEVGLLVAVQIGRLTVVAQHVAPCTAPGRRGMKGERSAVTAQPRGGPVQQEKLRRPHVSMQASRNRHAGTGQGRLREEYVIMCFARQLS
jgi:hypothetical protein